MRLDLDRAYFVDAASGLAIPVAEEAAVGAVA
jgi:hypothetical protein